ncbi:MAG: DUF2970 domain-containing protein [Acidobacteriia bacterium]|nr:DUF2970 domain-containing protein [Terriglobia bacterium]
MSALDQLAAALEELGGIFHQLTAALEHLFSGIRDILAGFGDGFAPLLRLVGDVPASVLAALGGVEHRHGHADDGARQKPRKAVRAGFLFVFHFILIGIRHFVSAGTVLSAAPFTFCDILESWRKIPKTRKNSRIADRLILPTISIWSPCTVPWAWMPRWKRTSSTAFWSRTESLQSW